MTRNPYYPHKIAEKSRCTAVLFRVKNVTMSTNRTSFLKEWYSTITLSIPAVPVLLTVFWIDDIITAQQNSFDADTLDGCLHFVCKFNHRAERTLTLGELDNQNLKRRTAINQRPLAHTQLYLENLILPGGIKTCEPQKETCEQFRYSAAYH